MEKRVTVDDVGEMADRFMINLYKKRIRETKLDPRQLRGTWSEASDLLKSHFGRLTRVMDNNQGKLLNLYRTAVRELRQG
jgi:hypothetical protein